jgi:hypothetical protein
VVSLFAFVASKTVWSSIACSLAASCLQLPEISMGHVL